MRCSFVQTHIRCGHKKATDPVTSEWWLKSHGDILFEALLGPAHRTATKRAADQGTLASPSQVAAPTTGAPDARATD